MEREAEGNPYFAWSMANSDSEVEIIVGDVHRLLEQVPPVYSNLTVRRAFIVWMHCGQQNKFKDVCNYYHKLEALEETMTPEARAASRHHEFQLFSNRPPTSAFLKQLFPELYPNNPMDPDYITKVEAIKNERCLFKLEGFNKYRHPGISNKQIQETSKLIRHYCQTRYISPRKFLEEYQNYLEKSGLQASVNNVAHYIKIMTEEAEELLDENFPTNFSFLEDSDKDDDDDDDDSDDDDVVEESPAAKEEVKTDNNILKLLLKIKEEGKMKNDLIKAKKDDDDDDDKTDTCEQFFNLFRDNNGCRNNNSVADTPQTFEDFAKVLFQNTARFGSVENLGGTSNELLIYNPLTIDPRLSALQSIINRF